jgi:hypothetical protein
MKSYVVFLAVVVLVACGDRTSGSSDTSFEADQVRDAKSAVANSLKDPDSAQFRNVVYRAPHVCGEVNAKNGFGGYAGFKKFGWNSAYGAEIAGADGRLLMNEVCTK